MTRSSSGRSGKKLKGKKGKETARSSSAGDVTAPSSTLS